MLFLECSLSNLGLVTALNGGDQPGFVLNEFGGVETQYLVITPGMPNRFIDWRVFRRYSKIFGLEKTQRKMYYSRSSA